jgi:long-chain acyl-CoA synthetase
MSGKVPALHELLERDRDAMAVDDLTRQRTWAELNDRVARLRALLATLGVEPGQNIAMVAGNRVEFVELVLAALTSGVWLTPVNWHASPDELAYVLDDSGASLVFADPDNVDVVRRVARDRTVVEIGAPLDAALAAEVAAPLEPDRVPGANMFYTSGTTGRPKGVRRARRSTLASQLAAIREAGRVLGLEGSGPHLVTGPLYHAAPLGFAVMDLLNGASVVLMPTFDEEHTLELIDDRRVRNTHLVPTMFVRLLRLDAEVRAQFDGSSLRTVLHGAAPIAPSIKQAMIQWWGPVLVEYWGGSEGGVVTLVGSREWLDHPGTVGRATPTHEVFATNDDGDVLPPGENGVLWCRNTAVENVFEYHNDRDKTAKAFRDAVTYTLGDIGRVDADGYVYLADRVSNMIISGGVNIYPAEVEAALLEHPAVADVAVFGIPDDEWGESVRAAVELRRPVSDTEDLESDLIAWTRTRIAPFKAPKSFEFHDRLPRAATGKLAVRVLKAPHWPDAHEGSAGPEETSSAV